MMKRDHIMIDMVLQVLRMLHSMALMMRCQCLLLMEGPSPLVDLLLTFHDRQTETTGTELH